MSDDFGSKQIIRGTAITSLLTILSRILGFFRDLTVALVFGAGPFADAYFVAFRIPNLLRSFVAEGALSAAFVPIFSAEARKGNQAAQDAFRNVTTFLVFVTVLLTIAGMIYTEPLVDLIAPGFDSDKRQLCMLLTRIMLPYIIFVSLVAMINGALSSLKSFGASAAAQSVMNLVLIAGGILSAMTTPENGVLILSYSVLLGGIAQVAFQLPALKRAGLSLRIGFRQSGRIIRELVILMAPALVGATVYQLIIFSATVMASLLEAGSVSWLFYADRIVQLPIGIFSIALGSVLLPALSANIASLNHRSFSDNLLNSMRYTSYVLIPVTFFIFLAAPDLVSILFQRGAFDPHATAMTAAAVQGLSLGIWATSCQSLLMRAFMARRDNLTPTLLGLLNLSVNLIISLLLMGTITPGQSSLLASFLASMQLTLLEISPLSWNFGHVGLALASSCASLVSFLAIAVVYGRGEQKIDWGIFVRSTAITILAASVSGIIGFAIAGAISHAILRVSCAAVCFFPAFLLVAFLLQSRESRELLELLRNRLPIGR